MYAQPLYVSGVAIGGVNYNVLYVATMKIAFSHSMPMLRNPPSRFGK